LRLQLPLLRLFLFLLLCLLLSFLLLNLQNLENIPLQYKRGFLHLVCLGQSYALVLSLNVLFLLLIQFLLLDHLWLLLLKLPSLVLPLTVPYFLLLPN